MALRMDKERPCMGGWVGSGAYQDWQVSVVGEGCGRARKGDHNAGLARGIRRGHGPLRCGLPADTRPK